MHDTAPFVTAFQAIFTGGAWAGKLVAAMAVVSGIGALNGGATGLAGSPWTLQKRPFGSVPWPAPAPIVVIGSPSGICARTCQLARRIAGASRVVRPGK
jgi:hypothetical protein